MGWSTRVELADTGSQPVTQTVGFKPPYGGDSEYRTQPADRQWFYRPPRVLNEIRPQ